MWQWLICQSHDMDFSEEGLYRVDEVHCSDVHVGIAIITNTLQCAIEAPHKVYSGILYNLAWLGLAWPN